MPITYETPQPYNPSVSAAYGAAQEFDRLAPLVEQHNAAQQHNFLQAQLAQGHSRDQAVQGAAQRSLSGQLAAAQLAQRGQETAAQQQMHSESLQAHTADIQLHAMLQNQALSQQEQMHMQRMQSAIGEVLAGDYTPDEKLALVTKLKTGVDLYQMRQEKARAAQEEMNTNRVRHQDAQEVSRHTQNQKFILGDMKDIPFVKDPVTGEMRQFVIGKDGVPVDPHAEARLKNAQAKKLEHEANKEQKATDHPLKDVDVSKVINDAAAEADKWMNKLHPAGHEKAGQPVYPEFQEPGWREKFIQDETNRRLATIGRVMGHVQQSAAAPADSAWDRFLGGNQQPPNVGPTAPGQPEQPQPRPLKNPFADQGATAEMKPFKADRPDSMDETQKTMAEALTGAHDEINAADLDMEEKSEGRSHAAVALHLLQDFGSREAMPFAKRREFDAHFRAANHFLYEAQKRTAGRKDQKKAWVKRSVDKGGLASPDWGNW